MIFLAASLSLAALLLAGLRGAHWYFEPDGHTKRAIREAKAVSIEDAPSDAEVRITGTVAYVDEGGPLVAPISGRPCAAWQVLIEELVFEEGRKEPRWRRIMGEVKSRDFYVEDDTACAKVDGSQLDLLLTFDVHGEHRPGISEPHPRLAQLLYEEGLIHTTGMLVGCDKHVRYKEGILEAGERVSVVGRSTLERDLSRPGDGYRDVAMRKHIKTLHDGRLLVTDDPTLTT